MSPPRRAERFRGTIGDTGPPAPRRHGDGIDVLPFQRKWIDASRQKERSACVTHFNDLCEVLGAPKPLDADHAGDTYAFEKGKVRERWLNPEGASEADLQKRTLTNLYNQRPAWLQHAHGALDRAVWSAYGWPEDEDPATVEEDVIFAARTGRLLALNGERAGVA